MAHTLLIAHSLLNAVTHASYLAPLLAPAPPVVFDDLTALVVAWIVKIVGSIAVVFLVFSIVGQLDPSKRDIRMMVMEIFGTLALIACIAKTTEIMTLLLAAVGIKG